MLHQHSPLQLIVALLEFQVGECFNGWCTGQDDGADYTTRFEVLWGDTGSKERLQIGCAPGHDPQYSIADSAQGTARVAEGNHASWVAKPPDSPLCWVRQAAAVPLATAFALPRN